MEQVKLWHILAVRHLGGSCKTCGDHDSTLNIHHVNGNFSHNQDSNLLLLCKKCHQELHLRKGGNDFIQSLRQNLGSQKLGRPQDGKHHPKLRAYWREKQRFHRSTERKKKGKR